MLCYYNLKDGIDTGIVKRYVEKQTRSKPRKEIFRDTPDGDECYYTWNEGDVEVQLSFLEGDVLCQHPKSLIVSNKSVIKEYGKAY